MHKPDDKNRQIVETMSGYGVPEADIAKTLGLALQTFKKYYEQQIRDGRVNANSKVAQSLFEKAMGNGSSSVTACIFWLKCRAGWVEPRVWDHGPSKKEQLQKAAEKAGDVGTPWANDIETEIRAN